MEYNVIIYDFNLKKFIPYDIFPYLLNRYRSLKKSNLPQSFTDFKLFILEEAKYQWWGRCEYEMILQSWPKFDYEEKWDIYQQIKINIDIITKLFMEYINKK